MFRLTSAGVKAWAQFYARLIGTNIWNGFLMWFKVTCASLAVHASGLVTFEGFSWQGAMWTLAGTIALNISMALERNRLPEPTPPPQPTDVRQPNPPIL